MSNKSNNEIKKTMMMGESPEENKNVLKKSMIAGKLPEETKNQETKNQETNNQETNNIKSVFKRFKNGGSNNSDDLSK